MRALFVLAAIALLSACSSGPEIVAPDERPPVADLGPLPAAPTPPSVTARAEGGYVAFTPEEALELHNHIRRAIPAWEARVRAMYRFYRCQSVTCPARDPPPLSDGPS